MIISRNICMATRAMLIFSGFFGISVVPAGAQEWPATTNTPAELVRPDLAEPLSGEDTNAVRETVIRIYLAEDRRDSEALRQLVTEDLIHAHSVFGTVEGADAFVEFVEDTPEAFDHIRHQALNTVTRRVGPNRAEALSYILVIQIYPNLEQDPSAYPKIIGHGVVRDELVKTGGRWRIKHRIYDQMAVSATLASDVQDRKRFSRSIDKED